MLVVQEYVRHLSTSIARSDGGTQEGSAAQESVGESDAGQCVCVCVCVCVRVPVRMRVHFIFVHIMICYLSVTVQC